MSHLRRHFPFELYGKNLWLLHRLMTYQRHQRVRLAFDWKKLWAGPLPCLMSSLLHIKLFLISALFVLLRFFVTNEALFELPQTFGVVTQVLCPSALQSYAHWP